MLVFFFFFFKQTIKWTTPNYLTPDSGSWLRKFYHLGCRHFMWIHLRIQPLFLKVQLSHPPKPYSTRCLSPELLLCIVLLSRWVSHCGQQLWGWKRFSFISLADKKPEQRSSFRHRTKGALKAVFQHLQVPEERGWRKLLTYEPADNFPATHQCPGAQATLH